MGVFLTGNLKWEQQYRLLENGHKAVTWYLTPEQHDTELVVHFDGYDTSHASLPGTVSTFIGILVVIVGLVVYFHELLIYMYKAIVGD